jgi:hypothetical protein
MDRIGLYLDLRSSMMVNLVIAWHRHTTNTMASTFFKRNLQLQFRLFDLQFRGFSVFLLFVCIANNANFNINNDLSDSHHHNSPPRSRGLVRERRAGACRRVLHRVQRRRYNLLHRRGARIRHCHRCDWSAFLVGNAHRRRRRGSRSDGSDVRCDSRFMHGGMHYNNRCSYPVTMTR